MVCVPGPPSACPTTGMCPGAAFLQTPPWPSYRPRPWRGVRLAPFGGLAPGHPVGGTPPARGTVRERGGPISDGGYPPAAIDLVLHYVRPPFSGWPVGGARVARARPSGRPPCWPSSRPRGPQPRECGRWGGDRAHFKQFWVPPPLLGPAPPPADPGSGRGGAAPRFSPLRPLAGGGGWPAPRGRLQERLRRHRQPGAGVTLCCASPRPGPPAPGPGPRPRAPGKGHPGPGPGLGARVPGPGTSSSTSSSTSVRNEYGFGFATASAY